MIAAIGTLTRSVPPYLRYVAVSAMALGVDLASFLLLISAAVPAALASGLGYVFGMAAHWLLSSRFVFGTALADAGPLRRRQQALFVGTALMGLSLTVAIVGAGAAFGFDPRIAKLIAVGVSFQTTYMLRQAFVFK